MLYISPFHLIMPFYRFSFPLALFLSFFFLLTYPLSLFPCRDIPSTMGDRILIFQINRHITHSPYMYTAICRCHRTDDQNISPNGRSVPWNHHGRMVHLGDGSTTPLLAAVHRIKPRSARVPLKFWEQMKTWWCQSRLYGGHHIIMGATYDNWTKTTYLLLRRCVVERCRTEEDCRSIWKRTLRAFSF